MELVLGMIGASGVIYGVQLLKTVKTIPEIRWRKGHYAE